MTTARKQISPARSRLEGPPLLSRFHTPFPGACGQGSDNQKKETRRRRKQGPVLGWQGIAEQLLDEKGHCGRNGILDEANMRETGGGDKHVGRAVVGSGDASDKKAVCGLKREADTVHKRPWRGERPGKI